MSDDNGHPCCRCKVSRIDILGVCVVCGREKLKIKPKVPAYTSVDRSAA